MRSSAEPGRTVAVSFRALLLAASVVGVLGGLAAFLYAEVLRLLLAGVWETVHPWLASIASLAGLPGEVAGVLAITTAGGLLVGLTLKTLGVPGEIAAVVNNIHLEDGRIPVKQTPSMLAASLASIVAGGSAGPEAPLIQMIGSGGSWLGDRLRWVSVHVRTLTFCGMASALGAFFGAPLAGAIFALEIPHRNGLEYYEALLPAVLAAFLSYWVFDSLGGNPHPLFPLAFEPDRATTVLLAKGVLLGGIGAGVALLFTEAFRGIGWILKRWHSRHVLLGTVGGLLLGLLAVFSPSELPAGTLFWGEFEMREILLQAAEIELTMAWVLPLLLLAAMKVAAVGVTLHTGFRGGFIFPLFFIGGVSGIALSILTGGWFSLPVSVLCLMAAVNVGVTRTPISTTVLLGTLSGTASVPVVLAASLTSFMLTARVRMIQTQRARRLPNSLTWREQDA